MATLSPTPINNKTTGLLLVVLVHLVILWGLIKQTGHIHLRDHKIVVQTLILSPATAPHHISVSPPITAQKKVIKSTPNKVQPQAPIAPHKTLSAPINQPPAPSLPTTKAEQSPPSNHSATTHKTTNPTIDTHYPCAAPSYPSSARRNGEQGTVLLSFLINETGQVENSKVLQSSGSSALDNAALNALSQCHFKPATEDGHAVAIRVTIPYVWRLN
ncbi:MAG: TonB family protein [Betaproteobacteria bacterium]|nr:TonB family protein [Betaproteobacteria bacterium]